MRLYASLTSPFARKARVVLAEKKIDCELVVDNPWSADSNVPSHNPLGKVPVLVLDDGTSVFDSSVIVDYLDTVTPVGRLIPAHTRQRITVKRWEALGDGICEAGVSIFLERKRPQPQQSADWIERQRGKIEAGLKSIALELGEKNWCCAESFSLADIAVGCALFYLDFRFPEIGWRKEHPNLTRLADKLAKRHSFEETVPSG